MAQRKTFVDSAQSVHALPEAEARREELRALSAQRLAEFALSQGIDEVGQGIP